MQIIHFGTLFGADRILICMMFIAGLMNRDYETLLNNSPSTITHYNGTGTAMSIAANRISYIFNLTGPSFAIDSACSSSLVALHSACQAIRQGNDTVLILESVHCFIFTH